MVGVQSGRGLRQLGTLFTRGAIGHKTDAELLDLFARRDDREEAFEALVMRHGPSVLRACRRVLADPNDAEDAFQATFLILAHRAGSGSIGHPEALGSWLYGVALRVARKARVAAARRRRHEQQFAGRLDGDCEDRHDITSALREEIDGLPESLRRPVVLCYLEEMTYRSAARLLRVSEGTIRGRLAKARGLLRIRLSRKTGVAPARPREASESQLHAIGVPPALISATIRSARTLTPGGVSSLGISAAVAELMEGVLTMMLVTRWMVGAVVVATLGLAAAGGIALAAKDPDDKIGAARISEGRPSAPEAEDLELKLLGDKRDALAIPEKAHPASVMTLETAIDLLIKKNLSVAPGRLEIPMARADVLAANFRARPQFDTNISYPPDVSFKRRTRPRSETAARTVAEAQLQDSICEQIDSLCTVFVDLQAAQEKAQQARENRKTWGRVVRATETRLSQGTGSREDLTSTKSAYEESKTQFLMTQETLYRIWHRLGLLIEIPDEKVLYLYKVEELPPVRSIPPLDDLIRLALESRSDLVALRLGLQRAQADLNEETKRLAGSDVYTLYQPYTFQDNSPNGVKGATSWALGVTVPLPIYNRNQGGTERAKINVRQSQLQLATAERQIRSRVERCYRECRATLVEPAALEKEMQAASQHRDAALRRYQAGEIGLDAVLSAMQKFIFVDRGCVMALVKHRRSTLALNTAVGMRILP